MMHILLLKELLLLKEQKIEISMIEIFFINNAPFISCISKISNTIIDNAKDLDNVMLMYKLIEHSKNYRKTTGSL